MIYKRKIKLKKGDPVIVDYGNNAEPREGVILESKKIGGLSKVKVTYGDKTMDCWIKNKFLTKNK